MVTDLAGHIQKVVHNERDLIGDLGKKEELEGARNWEPISDPQGAKRTPSLLLQEKPQQHTKMIKLTTSLRDLKQEEVNVRHARGSIQGQKRARRGGRPERIRGGQWSPGFS